MINNIVPADESNSVNENNLFAFFKLNSNLYALHTYHTVEVLKLPLIDYPEKLPDYIIGLLNYNNLTIKVIDLRTLLNIEMRDYSIHNQLMILRTEESIFAIIVDEVVDILTILPPDMQMTPYNSSDNVVKMLYRLNDEMVSIIDLYSVERILKNDEYKPAQYDYSKLFPKDEKFLAVLKNRSHSLCVKMQSNLSPVLYNQEQFLSFKLSERIYSINIKFVKEIVKYKSVSLTFLPFTPDYIDGIINLRGEFVTILNLKRFLNLSDEEQAPPKGLIVLNSREYKLAISADEIQNISYINNDKLNYSAQSKVDSKYVMAELVEDDCVYNILNVEKILNDDKLFINVEN